MEKEKFYEELKKIGKYSPISLKWDRGNGVLERMAYFSGFDEDNNPIIHFENSMLDIEKIGGYESIISVQEECPDGACVKHK